MRVLTCNRTQRERRRRAGGRRGHTHDVKGVADSRSKGSGKRPGKELHLHARGWVAGATVSNGPLAPKLRTKKFDSFVIPMADLIGP